MGNEYKVKLTTQAFEQLSDAKQYITDTLLEPEIALNWLNHMQSEMSKLSTMPARFPLTDEEPWRSRGIHKMTVKNYLVYYYIDEEKSAVWITGVIYARRDQLKQLQNMEFDEL